MNRPEIPQYLRDAAARYKAARQRGDTVDVRDMRMRNEYERMRQALAKSA